MALENLVVKISGDESPLIKSTKRAAGALGTLGRGVGKLAAGAGLLGGALAGGAAAGATLLANQSRESIDATRKLAVNMKTSASEAQALQHTFTLLGVSSDDGIKTFQRLTRSLGDSKLTSAATKHALSELGLTLEDLSGKAPIDQFTIVTDALGGLEDANARAQVAAQLFGRQWQELNVLFEDGGRTLAASKELFVGLGLGLGDAGAEVEAMNDAMATLGVIGTSLRDKVFAALAPKLLEIAAGAEKFVTQLIEGAGGADKLTEIIVGNLVQGVRTLTEWLGGVGRAAKVVGDIFSTLGKVFAWVGEIAGGVVAIAVRIAQGDFSGALAIGRELFSSDTDESSAETNDELRKQTEMLSRIASNSFAAVLS